MCQYSDVILIFVTLETIFDQVFEVPSFREIYHLTYLLSAQYNRVTPAVTM